MQRESVQLNGVIAHVLQVLEPEIAPRGIEVQQALSKDLPELNADGGQLFQAFYNLIRNAFQSIPGEEFGGIYIQTDYNDTDVRVIIGDNGTGISHEVMGNMYEPFRTTKRKGNGLGLLIVRHIIKEHGGTLSLASRVGTGTTVTITLPRADRVVRLLPSVISHTPTAIKHTAAIFCGVRVSTPRKIPAAAAMAVECNCRP